MSSSTSFIRLHKDKPSVSSSNYDDVEAEYAKALRSEHRKLSMQCILTYTTLFNSFQTLFNTGKATLTRISADFDSFDKIIQKYDISKHFPPKQESSSSSKQKRSLQPVQPPSFLGDDISDDEIDIVIDDAVGKSDVTQQDTSQPPATEATTNELVKKPSFKLRLSLDLSSNESLSSKGTGSGSRPWDCGSSSAGFSTIGSEEENYNDEESENERRRKQPFTTKSTASLMISRLVERESKYMLDLTTLTSLHNKLLSVPELSKGTTAAALVESMFSKLPALVDAEILLSNKLNSCLTSPDPLGTMHAAFESCKDGITNAYQEYVSHYGAAYTAYRRIKKRPCFSNAVRTILGSRDFCDILEVPCGHVHDLRVLIQSVLEGVAPLAPPPEALTKTIAIVENDILPAVTKSMTLSEQSKTLLRIKSTVSGADNRLFEPVRSFIYDGTLRLTAVSPSRSGYALWPEDANRMANAKLIPGCDYHLFVFSDLLLICRDTHSSHYPVESAPLGYDKSTTATTTGTGGSHSRTGSNLSMSSNSGSDGGFSNKSDSSGGSSGGSYGFGSDGSGSDIGGSLTSSSSGGVGDGSASGSSSKRRRYEVCAQFSIANVEVSESVIAGKTISMPSIGSGSGTKCRAKRFIIAYKTHTYAFVAQTNALCGAWVKCLRYAASARASTQVFGVPLSVVMSHDSESDSTIPSFLSAAFEVFEKSETACLRKGLFRVSSNELMMMQLQARIDAGESPSEVLAGSDPLLVANMIKKWFHMLPKAIVFFEDFNEAIESKDLDAFKELIDTKLSATEKFIVMELFETLRRIEEHKKDNEMNLHNLCVVTAPFLVRPRAPSSAMLCSGTSASIVKFIFKNFDFLFKDVTSEHSVKKSTHTRKRSQTQTKDSSLILPALTLSKSPMNVVPVLSSPLKNEDSQISPVSTPRSADQTKKKKKKSSSKPEEKEGCGEVDNNNSEHQSSHSSKREKSKKIKEGDDFSTPPSATLPSFVLSSSSKKKSSRSRSKTLATPN